MRRVEGGEATPTILGEFAGTLAPNLPVISTGPTPTEDDESDAMIRTNPLMLSTERSLPRMSARTRRFPSGQQAQARGIQSLRAPSPVLDAGDLLTRRPHRNSFDSIFAWYSGDSFG